jgi:hypothetical protein
MAEEEFSAASQQVPLSFQALTDAAYRAANSLSAISTNSIGQTAQAQGMMNGIPSMPPGMPPYAAYGAFQAAMYGSQASPFSPQASMARDMFASQMAMMGPGMAGPGANGMVSPGGIATPFGDATVNPFLRSGAAPYQLPTPVLAGIGSPGQPFDPVRSRFVLGMGTGSAINTAFNMGSMAFMGGMLSDNLEDRIYRRAERMQAYTADNMYQFGLGAVGLGSSFPGAFLGAGVGSGISNALFGGAGRAVFAAAGGLAGGFIAPAALAAIESRAQPYRQAAQELRDYASPYMRGSRIGGGLTMRETLDMTRDLEKQVAKDQFFTAEDYRTLVGMAGETGAFQFTGDREQALKALENMGKSVKTLFALGVSSRDQLGQISTALNQFGVSAAANPQQLANTFQAFAGMAQSAGMSIPQLTQAVAPAAQMFAAQGIGPLAGAMIAGQNFGLSGAYFRMGGSAFDNAYFGGAQGFGQSLTNATGSMLRSPLGQFMMASAMAPGSNVMGRLVRGQGTSALDFVNNMGAYAMDPLGYMGQQARMPELTQGLGGIIQPAMIESAIATFRQMYGTEGPIDSDHFLAFLMSMGVAENDALAMVKAIARMPELAQDLRRSARDQASIQGLERRRRMSLGRRFEKAVERAVDPMVVGVTTATQAGALNLLDLGARGLSAVVNSGVARGLGITGFLSGGDGSFLGGRTYEELMSGELRANLGGLSYLADHSEVLKRHAETREFVSQLNQGRASAVDSVEGLARRSSERLTREMLQDPDARALARRALGERGASQEDITAVLRQYREQPLGREVFEQLSARSDALRQVHDELRREMLPGAYQGSGMDRVGRFAGREGQNYELKEELTNVLALNKVTDMQGRYKNVIQQTLAIQKADQAPVDLATLRNQVGRGVYSEAFGRATSNLTAKTQTGRTEQLMGNLVREFPGMFANKSLNDVLSDRDAANKLTNLVTVASERFGSSDSAVSDAPEFLASLNAATPESLLNLEVSAEGLKNSLSMFRDGIFGNSAIGKELSGEGKYQGKLVPLMRKQMLADFLTRYKTVDEARAAWQRQYSNNPQEAALFDAFLREEGITNNLSREEIATHFSQQRERARGMLNEDERAAYDRVSAEMSQRAAARTVGDAVFAKTGLTPEDNFSAQATLALFKAERINDDLVNQKRGMDDGQRERVRGAFLDANIAPEKANQLLTQMGVGNLSQVAAEIRSNRELQSRLGDNAAPIVSALTQAAQGTVTNRAMLKRAFGKADMSDATLDSLTAGGNLQNNAAQILIQALGGAGSTSASGKRFTDADTESQEAAQLRVLQAQEELATRYEGIARSIDSSRVEAQQKAINDLVATLGGPQSGFIKQLEEFNKNGVRVTGEVDIKVNGQSVGTTPLNQVAPDQVPVPRPS